MLVFIWIIQLIFIPFFSPLCIGIIRKIKAKLQNRQGANIFQPYRDLWKLLHKDEVISSDASWIFKFTPYIIFAVTLVVGLSVPLFLPRIVGFVTSDILFIVYALAISTFFMALAGMDTGSAFGGFGSSREMTIAALAEGGFIFSLLTMALIAGSSNLFTIAGLTRSIDSQSFLPAILAFGGFFIILLAETSRFPFDNPATHLELTMVHEAMILECSGKRLALMEWAASNKLLIFMSLGANLFFPFGLDLNVGLGTIVLGMFYFLIKIFLFCVVVALLESSIAKFRFFRLPDLLLVSFIFNVVAIGLIK
ncbi:MAG: formate hydrogenlyase [Candidatus Magasanikbacteria bacterium CG_4_10_14_0_2_um_filter_33_14]|uniref:Formate hydrogenlyase n=1 Tax=Candidatus Magasanikbacteria bacterium CG_4_10_14_0_2_um_filter_33_14 TaxID=1974636 RepID=A0A2M7V9W4_9BACT|nr:MAG: formate hydrogenlyase [Candidatus Magasanikbacteria bacterium CG_4_10_14_0_2_um_filter_33_14]